MVPSIKVGQLWKILKDGDDEKSSQKAGDLYRIEFVTRNGEKCVIYNQSRDISGNGNYPTRYFDDKQLWEFVSEPQLCTECNENPVGADDFLCMACRNSQPEAMLTGRMIVTAASEPKIAEYTWVKDRLTLTVDGMSVDIDAKDAPRDFVKGLALFLDRVK